MKNILLGIIFLFVIGGGVYYFSIQQKEPVYENSNQKVYQSQEGGYEFQVPSEWELVQDDVLTQQGRVKLVYKANDTSYPVFVNASERGGLEADEIKGENMNIGQYQFIKRSWIKDGRTIFVVYMPDSDNFKTGNIEINLPPTEHQKYLEVLEKMISTFKFSR